MARDERTVASPAVPVPWREIWRAWALSLGGTLLLGALLFALQPSVWWVGLAGVVSLFVGGAFVGWRVKEAEPLYGALLAILYFGLVALILFGGELAGILPDPLPGLGIGDSTFFFVWPLLQLVASVLGSVVGGRLQGSHSQGGYHP